MASNMPDDLADDVLSTTSLCPVEIEGQWAYVHAKADGAVTGPESG